MAFGEGNIVALFVSGFFQGELSSELQYLLDFLALNCRAPMKVFGNLGPVWQADYQHLAATEAFVGTQ
jgi:hypothetical protein